MFSLHIFNSECCYLGHLGVADTLNCLLSRRTPWDEPLYGVIYYSTAGDIQAAFPKCSVPHQDGLFSGATFPLRWRQRRGGDTDRRCKKGDTATKYVAVPHDGRVRLTQRCLFGQSQQNNVYTHQEKKNLHQYFIVKLFRRHTTYLVLG